MRSQLFHRTMRLAPLALALLLAACGGRPLPPPAPPPAPVAPAGPPPFTATEVWTREPGLSLRNDSSPAVPIPNLFTRLEVLRVDSTALLVRCHVCRGAQTGWIARDRVAYEARAPIDAARLDLPDFALAVRDAIRRRDVQALQRVMARDFLSSHFGPEGALEAVNSWRRRNFADLDRVPFLLDRGIVNLPGTPVWAAPPEYAANLLYSDLRTGFRRGPDGWEWIFLVRPGM